ncbi:single-strand selective monofunctional uracil DNA glycosylase isoform X2 [Eurytemora carolleeae]|uniref:single-strand selective monofunctional uracil DNA glycosylase isoform X2 n=1 Tax=Eurytemora carolleeae TaxID=1294199 RepID=UPI000C76CAA6|nr:single-strand selective monofunctional uracil DNA glycosylase isoform X2 [Eurytemora carolleeae]|eukprot:XP_023328801.1 single-strand selective monofunctional uracil DNA glycosylase-like isoform X2 [Eurytemora affinis]
MSDLRDVTDDRYSHHADLQPYADDLLDLEAHSNNFQSQTDLQTVAFNLQGQENIDLHKQNFDLHGQNVDLWEEEVDLEGQIADLPSVLFRPFFTETIRDKVLKIEVKLAEYLMTLDYTRSPVKYLSNPLDHAELPHRIFLQKYLDGEKKIIFLGMNPGPWGMCQTGIPFGEIEACKGFLGISAPVKTPKTFHPRRPIEGFDCKRKEVSGQRFWSLIKEVSRTPDTFFKHSFLANHCPLAFMKESGKNVTPPEMPKELREKIMTACDSSLLEILDLLKTDLIIGIGKFAENRGKKIVKENKLKTRVGFLMHPSPINPLANKGWNDIALKQLAELDVLQYIS